MKTWGVALAAVATAFALSATQTAAAEVRLLPLQTAGAGSAVIEGHIGIEYVAVPRWSHTISEAPLHCSDIVVTARSDGDHRYASRAYGDINSGSCEYHLNVGGVATGGAPMTIDWSAPADKCKAIKSSPMTVIVSSGQVQRADFGALVGLVARKTTL